MTEEKKKIGFGKHVLMAIKDFDKYTIFAVENVGTAILYLLKLVLIFTILIGFVFTYQVNRAVTKISEYFQQAIVTVDYTEGELQVNEGEPLVIEEEKNAIQILVIATNASKEEEEQYRKKMEKYDCGIVLLKEEIWYKNTILNQNGQYPYKDLLKQYGIEEFGIEEVQKVLSNFGGIQVFGVFFFLMVVYLFTVYLVTTLIDAIMLAVLGYLLARVLGVRIRFRAIFNIGIYALTLPIVLNLIYIVINAITGFTIQYFQWMYTTISYIYVIVAILMIKSDLMNRKVELMKLEEEQKKVREELRKKEDEEGSPKGEDEPKSHEEEKKQEKENKDNNVGEEPEGSNA